MILSAALQGLLGPVAIQELALVDPARRATTIAALETCAGALQMVDALDLAPHELAEVGTADLTVWSNIASDVRNVLVTVQAALDQLRKLFPSNSTGAAAADTDSLSIEDMFAVEKSGIWNEGDLDTVVRGAVGGSQAEMGEAVATLAAMLHGDVVAFGQQLRRPEIVGDRWSLLGLVQEFKTSCEQCLEAVVASILGAITSRDLDNLIPRYRAAAARTVELRRVLVALSYDVSALNEALQRAAPHEVFEVKYLLEERIDAFMTSPGARFIRASDKRLIVMLKVYLRDCSDDDVSGLLKYVDDVTRSIELLRDINRRDVLEKHDAEALDAAIALLGANAPLNEALPFIVKTFGRNPDLDRRMLSWRAGPDLHDTGALAALLMVRESLPR